MEGARGEDGPAAVHCGFMICSELAWRYRQRGGFPVDRLVGFVLGCFVNDGSVEDLVW